MPRQGSTFRVDLDPAPIGVDDVTRNWVETQLKKLMGQTNLASDGSCQVLYAPPAKPESGWIRYADGTSWNPGYGRGYYGYDENSASWILLGSAITAINKGLYSVRGFLGVPNSTTKIDLTATYVQLWNPTTEGTEIVPAGSTITVDLATAGPVANGRDKSAAFTGPWVYVYYIWNGTTLASITSETGPATGPVLPTGYTHWALATIWNNVLQSVIRAVGCHVYYDNAQAAVTNGAATTQTAVSLTSLVPPEALSIYLNPTTWSMTTDASGNLIATCAVRVQTGVTYKLVVDVSITAGLAASSSTRVNAAAHFWIPNVSRNFYYIWTVSNGSAQLVTIGVQGFSVPNGDA